MSESSSALTFPYVALVGSPNSGKTSLFNSLTGSRQKVGNYPGVTVERKEGRIKTRGSKPIRILDLPGTYSLNATTLDEGVTRDVLLSGHFEKIPPSLLIAVADATNLERSLSLVMELKELGIPTLLALNMMDLAERRGLKINTQILERELQMPVIPVIATKRKSTNMLRRQIEEHLGEMKGEPHFADHVPLEQRPSHHSSKEKLIRRYREIDRILTAAKTKELRAPVWTHRIDRVVLHPFWGTVLLYVILALVFQSIFNWASHPMNWIDSGIGTLSGYVNGLLPENWFRSLWVDGIIAGVGAVVVFLPQILLLFFLILILEDSGYMARAAFLMDRHMRRAGLHGRAFLPLLSSFACAIPGIMATRTIENRRDRMTTILIAPLMACSARIPVYTLLIAAFIPNQKIWGPIRLQGLVMLGLYLLGALVAFVVAGVIKKLLLKSPEPAFLMELPTYKWPSLVNVWHGMWERAKIFLKRAGTVILAASVLIWALSSYPRTENPSLSGKTVIEHSYAGQIGRAMEPVIKPLGFDWTIGVGLVTGVVAREVIVGTLATIYAVESQENGEASIPLSQTIQERWSLATGLSLLVFFVFAMQCISTLVVARRETNSWKWPAFMFVYMTALAYAASWITYHAAGYLIG